MSSWLTLTDAKDFLRKNSAASPDDPKLQRLVDAACELIEDKKGFVQSTPCDDTLVALPGGVVILKSRPLLEISAVTLLHPSGASIVFNQFDPTVGTPGWSFAGSTDNVGILAVPACEGDYVRVQYTAGYASIPENFTQAALELTLHNWRASQTNTGGKRPGVNVDAVIVPGSTAALPYRVRELLGLDGKQTTDEVLFA